MYHDDARREQLFPVLTAAQLATAAQFASGGPRGYRPHERLYAIGERNAPVFVVIAGDVLIQQRHRGAEQTLIVSLGRGAIVGEVSQLGGRAAVAEGVAGDAGCEVLSYNATHLRALINGSAEIGEILIRAFILRRAALISGGAGAVLAGRLGDPGLLRLEGFLSRNGQPYSLIDVGDGDEGQLLVERFGLQSEDMPIVLCPDGTLLRSPSEVEVGECLGITPQLDPSRVYDVAVVGAGPPAWPPRCTRRQRACRWWCSKRARTAGRPVTRRASRIISASRRVYLDTLWRPGHLSRRRNLVPRSRFPCG